MDGGGVGVYVRMHGMTGALVMVHVTSDGACDGAYEVACDGTCDE